MKRFLIEDAKCGITDGGMACGPGMGNVVATVQFKENGQPQWISLIEVDGIPIFCLSDKDIYESLLREDDDDAFLAYREGHTISEFNGVAVGDDYEETFECFTSDPENPAVPLVRYLIALVRCEMDDLNELISMAAGKYADELNVPMSDLEEEYLEELEYED